jgi:hypothetical protein
MWLVIAKGGMEGLDRQHGSIVAESDWLGAQGFESDPDAKNVQPGVSSLKPFRCMTDGGEDEVQT